MVGLSIAKLRVKFLAAMISLVCPSVLYLFAKLSQAKPQLQLSWLALASLNFT